MKNVSGTTASVARAAADAWKMRLTSIDPRFGAIPHQNELMARDHPISWLDSLRVEKRVRYKSIRTSQIKVEGLRVVPE
jgi:hypothetical protein